MLALWESIIAMYDTVDNKKKTIFLYRILRDGF